MLRINATINRDGKCDNVSDFQSGYYVKLPVDLCTTPGNSKTFIDA